MDPRLAEIIRFLNQANVRATYGAVAGVLGVVPQSMGARLGPHAMERSWIVNARTGRPTGYTADNIHPALTSNPEIVTTSEELRHRMKRMKHRPSL